ncbi:MAG: pyridoxamine 5'-phosphate oxidase family protein [Chloroflexi bacterium]|nr:pyridoxamine 5'-phosphate oxidase family protein [Chloroflexota bacterium]MDA1146751.1 pyridoxamine 5'-phosphate oxidase family protein [Chloroflexota bacterium]MQC82879.1 pyridoxamine 5'-phosphate oxidase family protein [Chloroflexota bacterium]
MASSYDHITAEQRALIERAPLFFIASAHRELQPGPAGQGPVNVSPKGGVPLHVIDERHVAYLDYTGSGDETARHASSDGPVTVMVMSIDGQDAAIVRLYGRARVSPIEGSPLAERLLAQPAASIELPQRQVVEIEVESTATSCGYGVPVLEFRADRTRSERGRRYKA